MKINRRAFLSLTAISGASIFENSWSKSPIEILETYKLAIQQGYTTSDCSEFSIVFWKHQPVSAEVIDHENTRSLPVWSQVSGRPDSDYEVLKVYFENLTPETNYELILRNANGQVADSRNFTTLDLQKPNPKIAVISCMNDYLHRKAMWSAVAQKKPDILFVIGDSVYADHPSRIERRAADPKQLWERFVESRNKLSFYKMKDLIPTLAVWDDHDFGSNNSNRHYQYARETRENFLTFFAQSDFHKGLEKGPGLSMKFRAFGKDFYFLDGRTFRTANDELNDSMFGRDQENWLFSHLRGSDRPSWLLTGSQWFGGYLEKEGYEWTHPFSFKLFLQELKSSDARVQFISGDVHFSEVMQIEKDILGYPTKEITSSSIHSLTFPGWHRIKRNPRRLKGTSSHNYTVVEFENAESFEGSIECLGAGNKLIYSLRNS